LYSDVVGQRAWASWSCSRALGVGCGDVKSRSVARTICEAAGKTCTSSVSVQP